MMSCSHLPYMPPSLTIVSTGGTELERSLAEKQARLPVRLGGMGLTSQEAIRPAAWVGTWALCWRPLQHLHLPFRGIDISSSQHTITDATLRRRAGGIDLFKELADAHSALVARCSRVQAIYDDYDKNIFDFCKEGTAHFKFHPTGLPPAKTLLPLCSYGSDNEYLQHAQRRFSQIIHHQSWLQHWHSCAAVSAREAVRFISVSQPYAGAFLNAIPMRQVFRMHTWALRIQIQRRLGLPISDCVDGARSAKGKWLDALGDRAQNDGVSGHAGRHADLLTKIVSIAQTVWGRRVEMEPEDYLPYSSNSYKPDLVAHGLGRGGRSYIADNKFFNSVASEGTEVQRRGAYVGFGNTEPEARKLVHGHVERNSEGDGNFDPQTGGGHVSARVADYVHAIGLQHEVVVLLFETFGGFGDQVVKLLKRLAWQTRNKLSGRQYDETSWSARSWLSFMSQQLSVTLHISAAWEIGHELGLAVCFGTDPRDHVARPIRLGDFIAA